MQKHPAGTPKKVVFIYTVCMKRFTFLGVILLALLLLFRPTQADARTSFTPTPPGSAASQATAVEPASPAADVQGSLRFEILSLEEGLSQSSVRSIIQDRQGFLWIGTEDGLNRFDGYHFKVYRPLPNDPNSLSDRWISDLLADRDGYLWIGTRQGGLNRFDPRTELFTHYQHNPDDPASVSSDNIRSIAQDAAGSLWVGTFDGLDQLDPQTGQFRHFRNRPGELQQRQQRQNHCALGRSAGHPLGRHQ